MLKTIEILEVLRRDRFRMGFVAHYLEFMAVLDEIAEDQLASRASTGTESS